MTELVIAVDPGRSKCGLAVVHRHRGVLHQAIVDTPKLTEAVSDAVAAYHAELVVLGAGTSGKAAHAALQTANAEISIKLVDEYRTTDAARLRYWRENPPRGFRRLLPVSMLVPPVPVDDYAAVIIAERYFAQDRQK